MSFHPSKVLPAVIWNADPREYHQTGPEIARGNPGRIMSRGELRKFASNHQRWKLGHDEEQTDSMEWGALIDCLILTQDRFEATYVIAPESYPAEPKKKGDPVEEKPWNWNAKFCKDWRSAAQAAGKQVVKSDTASAAQAAAARLRKDAIVAAVLSDSKKQVWVNVDWHDEDSGLVVPVKCLLDIVPDPDGEFGKTLFDLKTDCNAAPRAWAKKVFTDGLHYQAALYLDAFNAATGLEYEQFGHIVQENFAPYEIARRLLADEWLNMGRADYRRDLSDYCHCLKTGEWPGYDDANKPGARIVGGWRIVEPEIWMITGDAA